MPSPFVFLFCLLPRVEPDEALAKQAVDAAHDHCGGRGADGNKLADFDGEGRPDVFSRWEDEGETRL